MVCTLWVPVLNAKSFVLSRPPICIFILSLVGFGFGLLGLGLFVKETTSILKNPDEMVIILKFVILFMFHLLNFSFAQGLE